MTVKTASEECSDQRIRALRRVSYSVDISSVTSL